MSRYSEEQMSGSARHTYSEPTEQERALMAMSTTQREELIDRMRYDAARATHLEKEARMKAQIAAATEVSLAGNHWYQAQQRGQLSQRVSVTNGQTTVEQLNAKAPPSNSSAFAVPPRAFVDSLRVTIGGIQLGPSRPGRWLKMARSAWRTTARRSRGPLRLMAMGLSDKLDRPRTASG
ncbi:hypothetical protein NKI51_00760 [Mesorhizobium australicum]|uniref:hypothetical protein n=1 Tax=Mesorhizobium australicum TaxID=536018 RepID=UPI003338D1F3